MSSKRTQAASYALGLLLLCLALLVVAHQRDEGRPLARVRAQIATGPLHANRANPRYFTDSSGKAVYLTGAHTWSNLLDRGSTDPVKVTFDYSAYIHWMVTENFNFMRLWTEELPNHSGTEDPYDSFVSLPWKWARTGPGNANDDALKFDFAEFDQNYYDRMRSRIITARDNGIYVAVMLFNGFEWQFETNSRDGNPFESSNNVNGISCPTTCPSDNSLMSKEVWSYEQAYIRKVIDTVNDLDNVLYEVSNEAGAPYSNAWQASVINYVKRYEATKPKQHPVGMTFQYKGGSDSILYQSDADWISPVARLPRGDGSKVIINDTDHSYAWPDLRRDGKTLQRSWVWENFTLGNNVAFMDPYLVIWPNRNSPIGSTSDPHIGVKPDSYWDAIRHAMGSTLTYANRMNLVAMTPRPDLSSTQYCLADPGLEYLVYQPVTGSFFLDLRAGTYEYEWLNPGTDRIALFGTIVVSDGNRQMTPPFSGDAVLYLHATKFSTEGN